MAFDSTEVAWRDLSVWLNGQRIGKFNKLKYKTTREYEHLHGAGDEPFDINPGNKAYTGEFQAYKSVIDQMNIAAQAAGGNDLTDVPWTLVANYKATATAPTQTDTLPNVRFTEFEKGMENNNKSMPINLPFLCLAPTTVNG